MTEVRATAVVLAAGEGTRMGTGEPKALIEVSGRPMLLWSIRALAAVEEVGAVYVAAHPRHVPAVSAALDRAPKVEAVVPGGPSRGASTRAALAALPQADGIVLVHDAARPAVQPGTVRHVIAAAAATGAATVAVPAVDTILTVESGRVANVPDRDTQWHAQTPQAFRLALLRRAHDAAEADGLEFTDDSGLVAHYAADVEIAIVPGSADNLKVTVLADLDRAARMLGGGARADTAS
jgi:2-C-methyl-D-erythritol 4-phosphate cytidylyltransferase